MLPSLFVYVLFIAFPGEPGIGRLVLVPSNPACAESYIVQRKLLEVIHGSL
jgi:hypothetical protein